MIAERTGPSCGRARHSKFRDSWHVAQNKENKRHLKHGEKKMRRVMISKPVPKISARAFCIIDCGSGRMLAGKNQHVALKVASLTKILVVKTALRLMDSDKLPKSLINEVVEVSRNAASTSGTSAQLRSGDKVCIRDLLYGALLPSGNDAAVCLAEHIGKYLAENGDKQLAQSLFVKEMNLESIRLGNSASSSIFTNPHGMDEEEATCGGGSDNNQAYGCTDYPRYALGEEPSKVPKVPTEYIRLPSLAKQFSTAYDMANISVAAMREHALFREIVATKHYICKERSTGRVIEWQNTNKMLWRSNRALGMKTGWTKQAGPCLCSAIRLPCTKRLQDSNYTGRISSGTGHMKTSRFRDVVVVTLNSDSPAARWLEHRKLQRWVQRATE